MQFEVADEVAVDNAWKLWTSVASRTVRLGTILEVIGVGNVDAVPHSMAYHGRWGEHLPSDRRVDSAGERAARPGHCHILTSVPVAMRSGSLADIDDFWSEARISTPAPAITKAPKMGLWQKVRGCGPCCVRGVGETRPRSLDRAALRD